MTQWRNRHNQAGNATFMVNLSGQNQSRLGNDYFVSIGALNVIQFSSVQNRTNQNLLSKCENILY